MHLSKYKQKEKELIHRMKRLKIYHKDIKEQFVRSAGPGGQNVNKTSTCVQLLHLPSGIQVKCQSERSQVQNRHAAMHLLVDKIERIEKEKHLLMVQNLQKKRRQNRKRPEFLKEAMLEKKHYKSEKKQARKKIRFKGLDNC